MIMNNLNSVDENNVTLGNAEDVCILCACEHAKEKKISLVQADRALRGKYEGKRMVRIPLSGIRATICIDHIHRIAAAHPIDEKAEA